MGRVNRRSGRPGVGNRLGRDRIPRSGPTGTAERWPAAVVEREVRKLCWRYQLALVAEQSTRSEREGKA